MIASGSEWVTNRAVAPCRSQQVEQQEAQAVGGRLVERDEGLVEQQQAGLDHEGPGEGRAPRHAERQARGEDVGRRLELDLGEGGGDPRRRIGRRRAARGADCRRPCARAAGAAPGRRSRACVPGASSRLPAKSGHQAGHDVEQRGLAAAGRADDRQPLARLDRRAGRWPGRRLAGAPPTAGKRCSRSSRLSAAIGRHGARSAAGCPTRSAGRRR